MYEAFISVCSLFTGPFAGQDSFALGLNVKDVHSGIMEGYTLVTTSALEGTDSPATCEAGAKMHYDKDLFGGDLTPTSYLSAASADECCAFCAYSSQCFAW